MTPRTALMSLTLAAFLCPTTVRAQSAEAKLRESKMKTYLARACTALDRLDEELKDEHVRGARVAATELRQALEALKEVHASEHSTSQRSFELLFGERAKAARQNTNVFRQLIEQRKQSKPTSRPHDKNLIFELLQEQQKAEREAAPVDLFNAIQQQATSRPSDASNPLLQLIELRHRQGKPEEGAHDTLLHPKQETLPSESEKAQPDESSKKKRKIYTSTAPAPAYRELEVSGTTVIVPEKLLGPTGEIVKRDDKLVIRKH